MGLFKKKLSDEELIQQNIAKQQEEAQATADGDKKDEDALGDTKLAVEVTKIKAQLEGLNEQRKASNERFSRISEEMGEIRGMIIETNKAVSRIEAATTKAIDMVESVKPDQLMIEVRKQDSKSEALKANIESNENMMQDVMKETKAMRKKMDFYKGVEQVAQMMEEIKKELIDMKKLEGTIDRHSSKVESIFIDVEKRYTELDKFQDVTKDLKRSFEKLQGDVDKLRVKVEKAADKKEVVTLLGKFNEFEKHTNNIINLLENKTKSSKEDIDKRFEILKEETDNNLNKALKKFNMDMNEIKEGKTENKKPSEKKKSIFSFLKKKDNKEENKEEDKTESEENKENSVDKKEEENAENKEESQDQNTNQENSDDKKQ